MRRVIVLCGWWWCASACASTVGSTAGDAAVTVDVPAARDAVVAPDVPSGPCRWTVGEPVVLRGPMAAGATRTLRDAQPDVDGVWMVTTDDGVTMLEHLDPRGHRLAFGALRLDAPADGASIAVDAALGRRAVLTESHDGCALSLFDTGARVSDPVRVAFPTGGFSLSGCRALAVNDDGYTFVSEQVRALWGLSLVQLDARGATPAQSPPSLLDGYPPVAYSRAALAARAFALASYGPGGARTPRGGVFVQRFDARGGAAGARQSVREDAGTIGDEGAVVTTDAGLFAAWVETPPGAAAPQVWLRALDAQAAPVGEAWSPEMFRLYQGGLAATYSRGAVLLTTIVGSGVLRPWALVLAPTAGDVGVGLALPLPDGAARTSGVRLAPTAEGALALYTADVGGSASVVVATPILCAQ